MTTAGCPHCGDELIPHGSENPLKEGAQHCNGCGCCFDASGSPRVGHPLCLQAGGGQTYEVEASASETPVEAEAEAEPEEAEEAEAPAPTRRSR